MRRFIIDTDTASDDAVALVMALRAQNIHVEAITCVHGNVPLQVASRNARISVQKAATYQPPVYQGLAIPLLRVLEHRAESAHGADGLGNMNYPEPNVPLADGNAVQKIVDIVAADDSGELELCAIGPMTNIAAAILLAPQVMKKVKNLTVMGGQWRMIDAFTPNAEFNIALDAEAVKIVLESGMHTTFVPIDVCYGHTEIDAADRAVLRSYHTEVGDFFIDSNRCLLEMNRGAYGKDIISMPDPTAIAVLIDPSIITGSFEARADIELRSPDGYGQLLYDLEADDKNCTVITEIDAAKFKELVFATAKY